MEPETFKAHTKVPQCETRAQDALFCQLLQRNNPDLAAEHCGTNAKAQPAKAMFLQLSAGRAPEDELAKEMTHDLEMNFNKIAPFGDDNGRQEGNIRHDQNH